MGWYYGHTSRKNLVSELTSGFTRGNNHIACVKHCYRGNAFRGVLWSVWERRLCVGVGSRVEGTWIKCDLMECVGGEWGYKPMEECMGPFYYSCPLGYLALVPDDSPGTNPEWREGVRAYHAERKRSQATPV